jgi:endonuclease III
LTVSAVAQADPEVLALHITNLQYYNSKAQQIVKAAKEIETEFHGIVPEDETSLLRLTGVGKVFADLLAFVNTHEIHERFETGAQAVVGITGNEEKQAEVASDAVEP